jgi:transposase
MIEKHEVLKGTRYLFLSNGKDIFDKEYKTRLDKALDMNKPIFKAYYLKEQLREIWSRQIKLKPRKFCWTESLRQKKAKCQN